MPIVKGSWLQTILYIKEMTCEVHFYRDVLGLEIRYPKDLENFEGQMWVEFKIGNASLALHGGVNEEPQSDHEIVFKVEDIGFARSRIIEAGFPMEEIRPLEDGTWISEGRDPEGHRFAIRS